MKATSGATQPRRRGRLMLVREMHDRRATPHALYPEIRPREVLGGDGRRRHDHLGGERFLDAVAGPIEVGLEHNRCVAGHSGLWRIGARTRESRAGQQPRRIPADALTLEARARVVFIDAHAQRSLPHIQEAAKAPGREDKIGGEGECAATAYKHLARREAADGTLEAEASLRGLGYER